MDSIIKQIREIAKHHKIQKILLFGSRARGDNSYVSDYDIAVFDDTLSEIDKARFCDYIEELETLKKFDVVFIDENIEDAFTQNIMRDGVVIYEQAEGKIE